MFQEYERAVIFRLGRVKRGGAVGPGLFFIVPCMDQFNVVDLRTVSFDVPPQVCPFTQFLSVSFLVKKIIDLPGGQINDPLIGETLLILFRSSQQLPRLRLVRCFRNYRDTTTPSGVLR